MADVTNLNTKIDHELKAEADRLFNEMGMNLTTAVNVFVQQAVLQRAIPFQIYHEAPNLGTNTSVKQRWAAKFEHAD